MDGSADPEGYTDGIPLGAIDGSDDPDGGAVTDASSAS
jgi:hypothetical protein